MSEKWKPQDVVKAEINENLWYPIECSNCHIFYLVQDVADKIHPRERMQKKENLKDRTFETTCPYCGFPNKSRANNRVSINCIKLVDNFELSRLLKESIDLTEI